MRPPFVGDSAGKPLGAGGARSLCRGLSLSSPRAGIKAGHSSVPLSPILHRLVFARRRPDAVRGLPLHAGAGLLACRGYCGSGRAADSGRAAYGPSCAPPRVPRPFQGGEEGGGSPLAWQRGCGAAVPLAGPLSPSIPPVLLFGGCRGAA